MLSRRFIRENEEKIRESIKHLGREEELSPVLDEFLKLDAEWRSLKAEIDSLRSKRNKLSEEINQRKKEGLPIDEIISAVREIPKKIKEYELRLATIESELKPLQRKIPNIVSPEVPKGDSDEENPEVYKNKEPEKPSFKPLNHVELCEKQGWADFEASAKTSGKGFYFLKGELALLNQALIRFAINKLVNKGYNYVEPPLMIKKKILDAAINTEEFENTIYTLCDGDSRAKKESDKNSEDPEENVGEELCLIGTAEHAILGLHTGETFQAKELPKKYVGYSMSFRKEIGSHGINEKGLWRTHQFNKVEQFVFCLPKDDEKYYQELYENSQEILEELGLTYRVVAICTGDLAIWKYKSHDFEVWRPTTESYGEVMSLSNCTTYQSTDLGIRYIDGDDKGFVHTLNNTALATSRIMVAILEQFQNPDGTVRVPKPLVEYLGKEVIGKPIRA